MNVPFSACVGADVEELIHEGNPDIAAKFFSKAIEELRTQQRIILCIPQGLFDCAAQDSYIKAVSSKLAHSTQSKVLIVSNVGAQCSSEMSAPVGFYTTEYVKSQIMKRELPFTIGISNVDITKCECVNCDPSRPCCPEMIFYSKHLDSSFIADIHSEHCMFIKNVAINALEIFYKNFILNPETRKLIARLLFIREGLDCSLLSEYDKVHFSDSFFDDANRASSEDKRDIVLSAARAFCFCPVKDRAKRENGSLDWHKDIQPLPKKVIFYRADVLPNLQTGRQNSGAKRLLFGRRLHDNKVILFGYTPEHDFDSEKLKQRWDCAEKELI